MKVANTLSVGLQSPSVTQMILKAAEEAAEMEHRGAMLTVRS
jgi:hypothetical protein